MYLEFHPLYLSARQFMCVEKVLEGLKLLQSGCRRPIWSTHNSFLPSLCFWVVSRGFVVLASTVNRYVVYPEKARVKVLVS